MAKRKISGAPVKYQPVPVAPVPATRDEQERHLRAFIREFIRPTAQSRRTHCLLDSPEKAAEHMHRFEHDQEPRSCNPMKGAEAFPCSLEQAYGNERGLYFDGERPPCRMTAAEAATMATEQSRDALLSLTPGKRVLFFHPDGIAWKCEQT